MEKEIIYSGIERINYKFTEEEIRDALMEMNMVKRDNVKEIIFDMFDAGGEAGKGYAELTLVFETVLEKKEKKKNGKKTDNKRIRTACITGSNYFHG